MKHTNPNLAVYRPQAPITPNAADHSYFARRALDVITAIVSGMGFISAMMFLAAIS